MRSGWPAGQQAYYDSREEVGKRFRKLAKPLVEQTRDLWKRIQQIKDPVLSFILY